METNSLTFLFPLCLGGIFTLMAISFLAFGLREQKKAKEASTWPITKGRQS